MSERDALREAVRAYLDAQAEPAYSWVIESQAARREGRPNHEVERMERIARARVRLEEALALPTEPALHDVRRYVQNNLDVWRLDHPPLDRADQLSAAYADIYQKVLNVIDTGDPLRAKLAAQGDSDHE